MYPDSICVADQMIAERVSRARNIGAENEELLSLLEMGLLHYEKCGEFADNPTATTEHVQQFLSGYRPQSVEDLSVLAGHLYEEAIQRASVEKHTRAVLEAIHRRHGFLREIMSHIVAGVVGALLVAGLAAYLNLFGLSVGKQQWEKDVSDTLHGISRDLKSISQGQK